MGDEDDRRVALLEGTEVLEAVAPKGGVADGWRPMGDWAQCGWEARRRFDAQILYQRDPLWRTEEPPFLAPELLGGSTGGDRGTPAPRSPAT
jgi:hypothetical protein